MLKLNTSFMLSTVGVLIFTVVYGLFIKTHVTGIAATDVTTVSIVKDLLMAGMLTYIFTSHFENKGLHGLRFGIVIGLLLGVVSLDGIKDLGETDKIVKSLIDGILYGVGSGWVLSLLNKDK